MDTKSRNIRYSKWFKLLAVALCVAGLITMAYGLLKTQDFPQAVQSRDYKDSQAYAEKVASVFNDVYTVAFQYKSEDNIRSGGCLDNDERYQVDVTNAKQESEYTIASLKDNPPQARPTDAPVRDEGDGQEPEVDAVLALQIKQEQDRLSAQLAKIKDEAIDRELNDFQAALDSLKSIDGMYYMAVPANGATVTNVAGSGAGEAFFAALPANVILHGNESNGILSRGYAYYRIVPKGCSVYVGMSEEQYARESGSFSASRSAGVAGICQVAAGAASFLLGLAWLMYAAGRRPATEGVRLLPVDRVWLDVALFVCGFVAAGCLFGMYNIYNALLIYSSANYGLAVAGLLALAACVALLAVLFFTSAAKRLKRREFLTHTLIYSVCAWLVRTVRKALDAGPLFLKWGLLFCGYVLVSSLLIVGVDGMRYNYNNAANTFLILMFLALNASVLVLILKKATALKAILAGTRKIKSGDLAHRIEPQGGAPFTDIASAVNNIAEGLNAAVDDRVKAERMKAELITNVSHDLKTPLTSIITYIDLLKAEGPGSENALQYIGVLDSKAKRLKALTDDLFEAAKAASGSIEPNLTKLDVVELLSQGLGELADRIKESSLDFRCNLYKEKLYILADGRLLWRVVENLLSNVFKYALPGSRVYLSAARGRGGVRVEIKNISAFELNIPAGELMERFTRGDASRSSEGSGLGLAIAKSLTELQGGVFNIEIDGDLFKAIVEFAEEA